LIILIFFLLYLWKLKEQYLLLHNLLKFIIVAGVFCIVIYRSIRIMEWKRMLMMA
jgi:4-hydroxybenzoate polyprenyltransferase